MAVLFTQVDSKPRLMDDLRMARTESTGSTSAVMTAVWEAVKLLAGPDGLHADDHLTRVEVIAEAQRALAVALDREVLAASRDGASLGDLAGVLGVSRAAVHKRIHKAA
jgi:DNA-directed RNA polymerase specialized sigma24 family protein